MVKEILRPNAPGDECNIPSEYGASCPNHYQNVDEEESDGNLTAVRILSTWGLWGRDLYNIEDHSEGSGIISSIVVKARCWGPTHMAIGKVKIAIKSGMGAGAPNTPDEGSIEGLTGIEKEYSKEWVNNPATNEPWTWDEIDKLQIGINLFSQTMDTSFCTQVWAEINYVLPSSSISGHIKDAETGFPISGASVRCDSGQTYTDELGYYAFTELPPAVYTLSVSVTSYEGQTKTVDATIPGTYTVNFDLVRKAIPPFDKRLLLIPFALIAAIGSVRILKLGK